MMGDQANKLLDDNYGEAHGKDVDGRTHDVTPTATTPTPTVCQFSDARAASVNSLLSDPAFQPDWNSGRISDDEIDGNAFLAAPSFRRDLEQPFGP